MFTKVLKNHSMTPGAKNHIAQRTFLGASPAILRKVFAFEVPRPVRCVGHEAAAAATASPLFTCSRTAQLRLTSWGAALTLTALFNQYARLYSPPAEKKTCFRMVHRTLVS